MISPQQQSIIKLIHKMRTQQVNEAEQTLMSLANNPTFMQTIFGIIKNNHLQNWVKTIASTFLNRVITEKLEQLGYKTMFAAINNIMSSYDILPTDKRCFERSLVSLIEYIKQPEEIEEWQSFINKYIEDPLLFDTALLLISCSAVADLSTDFLCMIVETTYEKTLKKVTVNVQNSYLLNELVKNWIVVFDKLFTIQNDEYALNIMKNMCDSPNLARLLYSIYQMQCPDEIWLTIKPQLYELNLLKHEAAELHRRINDYSISIQLTNSICPSLKVVYESYNIIKNTIAIVGTNLQILQNYQCEDFVTSLMSLLIGYIKSNGANLVKEEMEVFIHIDCYPFLKTRDEQMYIFEQSPIEFNSLMEDLCDKQQFGILKTEAAKLLEAIGDYCKPALQSSIMFAVECIKMRMGFIPVVQNTQMRILDFEVAFLVLSIHSFSLQNYPTQLQALKIILLDKRLMEVSPLDISKVFVFLAYNYGDVFKNPFDGSIWIEFALKYKKHPTSRYLSLDFLSNISDEYFTEDFFNEFIRLINECEQRQSGQIWNILGKIFDHQKSKISQTLCLNFVNQIFLRIEHEITKINQKSKESSLDIVNGLHILRKIVESVEYISTKTALAQRIFNITIIYNKTIELNIQDEIIKILTEYIKLFKEKIPVEVYSLLPQIVQHFKKQEYHEKSYFVLFNQIIVKGQYQQVKIILKVLLSGLMFHLFDMSSKAKQLKQKVVIANILTLLQTFIPIHGYEMGNNQENCFCEIEAMCMRLFPVEKQEKIFSKQLLAKALNVMLLCHIYNKSENTISYLILYAKENIFHRYDAYVLIKLLTKAVFNEQNIQMIIEILNIMVDITNEEQNNHKNYLKTTKTAKGKLRIKRDEELNKLLERITTPFVEPQIIKKQKYPLKKQVQECLKKMKSQNIDTFKIIMMNMNEQSKSKLTTLLNEVIQIEGKTRVIRKVTGVKQKNQNQGDNQNFDEEEEEQELNFKRNRLMKKKKQNKNKNEQQISVQ